MLRSTSLFCRARQNIADAKFTRLCKPVSTLAKVNPMPETAREVKQVHAKLLVSRSIVEVHLANTLLASYAKCGDLSSALLLFDEMPGKNTVSWTSMISAQVQVGDYMKAIDLFKGMLETGDMPNQYTLSVIVRACTNHGDLNTGLQIHGLMVHLGFVMDEFAGSSLMDMYSKIGNCIDNACFIFEELLKKDCVTWNIMISAFARAGESTKVLRLFKDMWLVDGLRPDDFTFTNLLKCCCLVSEVEQIQGLAMKFRFEADIVVGSALADMYGKCGDMVSSLKILEFMEKKDTFVWSSIISGYIRNGRGKDALLVLRDMCRGGIRPDERILSSAFKACSVIEDLDTGLQLHSQMIKNGYQKNSFVASVLSILYSCCKEIAEAEKLFRRMEDRDLITWNSIILSYAQIEDGCAFCVQFFRELVRTTSLKPDAATLVAVLKSCQTETDVVVGRQFHSLVQKSSLSEETAVSNSIIHMYSECGALDDSYKAFYDTLVKDDSSWSSIIGACQQNGLDFEALQLSKEMMSNGIHLTTYSLPSSIAACSGLASIDAGKQFQVFIIKLAFHRDIYVGSSLIDMYAKCGSMEESKKAFTEQEDRNEVTLNAMISGYAQHGKATEAIKLFNEMENMRLFPTPVTFLAVLSACSHVGLTEESLYFFNSMREKYRIKPQPEHYSCLVDAFGRAGRLEEAYRFLESDGSVAGWRTLLGACRNYGDREIAERTARKMIDSNPNDHASYVLLSNIYCEEGKWGEALKLREKMGKNEARKDLGGSRLVF